MFCSKCGSNNLDTAVTCKACGEVLAGGAEFGSLEYAGFWARFAALFLDSFILIPAFAVVGALTPKDPQTGAPGFAYYLFAYLVSLAYYASMESGAQSATLGKRIMTIKVLDANEERLTTGRAIGRWFAHFFSSITMLIGYLIQPFTQKKQALHDLIASTIVVRSEKKSEMSADVVIGILLAIFGMIYFVWALATVAIPQYNAYLTKARMVGAMAMGNQAAKKVGEYYLQARKIPATAEEAGFYQRPDQNFARVTVATNAVVTVTFINAGAALNDRSLVFTPTLEKDQTISWNCTSEMPIKLLPLSCQHVNPD